MRKLGAVCFAIFSLFLFRITHLQILSGDVLAGGKGHRVTVHIGDPRFWSTAALEYATATVILLIGILYFFTGYKYLPEFDRYNTGQNIIFAVICIAVIFPLGFILEYVLPKIYS